MEDKWDKTIVNDKGGKWGQGPLANQEEKKKCKPEMSQVYSKQT